MTRHPLHYAPIETFYGETGSIAPLKISGGLHKHLRGATEAEAFKAADVWRDKQVAEHEASFQKRQRAAAAARKARAA